MKYNNDHYKLPSTLSWFVIH